MSSSSSLKSESEGNWIIKLDFLSAERDGVLSYCLRAAAASHFPFLLLHNTVPPLKSTTSPNKRGEKQRLFSREKNEGRGGRGAKEKGGDEVSGFSPRPHAPHLYVRTVHALIVLVLRFAKGKGKEDQGDCIVLSSRLLQGRHKKWLHLQSGKENSLPREFFSGTHGPLIWFVVKSLFRDSSPSVFSLGAPPYNLPPLSPFFAPLLLQFVFNKEKRRHSLCNGLPAPPRPTDIHSPSRQNRCLFRPFRVSH